MASIESTPIESSVSATSAAPAPTVDSGAEVAPAVVHPTFKITCASATDLGGYAENQDRAFFTPDGFAGVCDGHGVYGAFFAQWTMEWLSAHPDAELNAATFAVIDEHLRERFAAHLTSKGVPFMIEEGAFYRMSYGFPLDSLRGGTTTTVTRINATDGSAIVAHIGDSELRVFDRGDPASTGHGVCADHSASSVEEYMRIKSSHPGADFVFDKARSYQPDRKVFVTTPAGETVINPAGPYKICDVRQSPGAYLRAVTGEMLAMTRAHGDFELKRHAGVTAEPHCQTVPPIPAETTERVIVLASDGFWDILHYEEVSEKLWSVESVEDMAAALMALAKEKTIERLGAPSDNITIVVMNIKRT